MGLNAPRHPAVIAVLVTGALLLTVPLAIDSIEVAAAIAGVLVLVIMVGWLGLEQTSVVFMVLAFALAPADRLGVSVLGVSDALFFLAFGLAFPRLLRTPITLPATFLFASLAFTTIALLSSVAVNDLGVYYYTLRVIFNFVVLPMMVVWWAPRGKVLVWLLVAFVAGTCISVLYGLPEGGFRNWGLSLGPNILGYTAMLAMSLIPFLYFALPERWRLWMCGAALSVIGVGILTSGSRAALVVAIGLVFLVPAVERSIPLGLTVAIACVAFVGFLGLRGTPTGGTDALSRLLGAGDVAGSNRMRIQRLEEVWTIAVDHPWLGAGFNLTAWNGHNVYVQVAAAIGFIGLAAFLVILASMVTTLFATSNNHSRLVYPAIVFIVAGPVSPQITDRYIGLLLGISLVGVNAVKAWRQAEAETKTEEVEPPRRLRLNR